MKDLTGRTFISPSHSSQCIWTVMRYHRGGAWVCRESDHQTECEFYAQDIERLTESTPEELASFYGRPK